MWTYIKRAIAGSFGASIGVTLAQLFRYPVQLSSMSGISGLVFNVVLTFLITTILVAGCIWLQERFFRKKQKR